MIEVEEFLDRLCRLGARTGPRRFPRGRRDREILIKSVMMGFDSERECDEAEVNRTLTRWNREVAPEIECDHVTLRRLLVDYGELERTADGRWYRVGFPVRPVAFDLEIDALDLVATIAAYRMEQDRQRASGARQRGADPERTS